MVSQALQAYFDSQSLGSLDEKFTQILRFIDPSYIEPFNNFRKHVLGFLADNPGIEVIISEELDNGINEFKSIDKKYAEVNKKATFVASEVKLGEKLKEYNRSRRR